MQDVYLKPTINRIKSLFRRIARVAAEEVEGEGKSTASDGIASAEEAAAAVEVESAVQEFANGLSDLYSIEYALGTWEDDGGFSP